ncbi:MAG TPA: cytochrome c peroxidase [Saprospiraceae bacterium]|nr:cytochrome c peroxidase [Saprospiraceae bacterium]
MKTTFTAALVLIAFSLITCSQEENQLQYDSTPYVFHLNGDLPDPAIPPDNPLTRQKVELGRMLFYEKKLSKDLTQSCADCHVQQDGFSDLRPFSIGVEKLPGKRNAMAIFNLAYHNNGFFWDGRAPMLRDQALKPIQDPLEMNETLPNAVAKIQSDKRYQEQFIRAFGTDTVDAFKISLALEQFMMTIVSHESKYDQYLKGEVSLSESEERGRELFFSETDPLNNLKGAECFHCHGGFNFTNNEYMNNGLDTDANFTDPGRNQVTGLEADRAKFKVPSLRNIAQTAPYMHDSRFTTLEQVIDHYNSGVKRSSTTSEILQHNFNGLQLTEQDKADLVAFLKTLSDFRYLNHPDYKSPF